MEFQRGVYLCDARDVSDGLEGKRRLERESAVKGWRGKGNAKEDEAAFFAWLARPWRIG